MFFVRLVVCKHAHLPLKTPSDVLARRRHTYLQTKHAENRSLLDGTIQVEIFGLSLHCESLKGLGIRWLATHALLRVPLVSNRARR